MYERKDSLQSKYFSGVKNDAIDWWDIEEASKDEWLNQTTTTYITYIKKFMSVLKIKTKVKIESDKTENKQNNL